MSSFRKELQSFATEDRRILHYVNGELLESAIIPHILFS